MVSLILGFSLLLSLREFPGVDDKEAHELLAAAHEKCPYSRVTRGNAEVELRVVS